MSVQLDISEYVAAITIESSEEGNRIGFETAYSLSDAATEVRQRDDVWVVVLRSDGNDFCMGVSTEVTEAALLPDAQIGSVRIAQAIADIEKPVVCAIQGMAQDQGLEIAISCDLRIAETDSTFAMKHILNGIMPWDGGTQRLPRLIGRSRAMDMLLTGRRVAASEALEIGLVNEVVGQGKTSERAMELASLIAGHGPIALRYLKEAVLNGMDGTLDQGLRLEADLSFLLQSTEDRSRGNIVLPRKTQPDLSGPMMSDEPTVLFHKEGAVGRLVLNRPGVINAFNVQMRDDLFAALEAVRDDPDVRSVLISGAGERGFLRGRRPYRIRHRSVPGDRSTGALGTRSLGSVWLDRQAAGRRAARVCDRIRSGNSLSVRPARRRRGRSIQNAGNGPGDGASGGRQPNASENNRAGSRNENTIG